MKLTQTSLNGRRGAIKSNCQIGSTKVVAYSDEWYTPPELVRSLGRFDLDPCAGPMSHAAVNIRRPQCGLSTPWAGRVWLNPPYSDDLPRWLEKMITHGSGIALVNVRAETQWFQQMATAAQALFFPKGRIPFRNPAGKVGRHPIASVLVAFSPADVAALRRSGIPGLLVIPESAKTAKTENRVKRALSPSPRLRVPESPRPRRLSAS